jgi:hypothetical protein
LFILKYIAVVTDFGDKLSFMIATSGVNMGIGGGGGGIVGGGGGGR